MSDVAHAPVVEGAAARRRYPRYQFSVPFDVRLFRPGNVIRLSGRTQDIGEGGLRGVISGAALPGERVELVILRPGPTQPLTMHAIVRHGGELHCGFEFLSLEDAQREQLQRLSEDSRLRAGIINGVEEEPGTAPAAKSGTVLCATCGYEFPEDAPMCVMCGTHQSPPEPVEEIIIERREPGKLVRPSMWGSSMSASAAYYKSRGSKSTVLDSVVAVVFLVTLSVGLWQWLNSPVDSSSSQPSSVTVELENVLLRPVPSAAMSSARDLTRGGSSSYTIPDRTRSFLQIEAEPIVGFSAPVPRKEPIGQPGSAVLESKRRRSPPAPALPQATSKPAASEQPSGPNLASAAQAATAAATQIAEQAREAADTVAAPPTALDLEGMLLQKVLPVYPTHARRQGLEGQVVLQAVIGKDGNIAQLRPLQGPQELTQAAIDAVQHWRFRPYEMNGKPVEVETDIRLNFQLPKK